jgi:hypothetical protein
VAAFTQRDERMRLDASMMAPIGSRGTAGRDPDWASRPADAINTAPIRATLNRISNVIDVPSLCVFQDGV